jgi:transposase
VNALAAYSPYGSQPALSWGLERGSIISGQFVDWIQRIPRLPGKALVIVIDNGSLHCSWVVKEALPKLREQRIYLYYLPPYSPKLNAIEAIFGGIKAHELPERRYETWEALEAAIITGFTHAEDRLLAKHYIQLVQAA